MNREPASNLAALDSFAGRLSLLPTDGLALQVSAGHLREAEAGVGGQPRGDVNRTTVSATYHRLFGRDAVWATTVAYGVNSHSATIPEGLLHQTTHALLAETSATAAERHTWFGRLEVAGKPAHDLHAHEFITSVFTVGKLQAGDVKSPETLEWAGPRAGGERQREHGAAPARTALQRTPRARLWAVLRGQTVTPSDCADRGVRSPQSGRDVREARSRVKRRLASFTLRSWGGSLDRYRWLNC